MSSPNIGGEKRGVKVQILPIPEPFKDLQQDNETFNENSYNSCSNYYNCK